MDNSELIGLVALLVAVWVPLLQMIGQTKPNSSAPLLNERVAASAVTSSFKLSAQLFGPRIFSVRAATVSTILSFFSAAIFLAIAFGLSAQEVQTIFLTELFASWIKFPAFLFFMFCFSAVIDFVSVCQTRLLLKRVSADTKLTSLLFYLTLDLLLSFLIFICTFPFVALLIEIVFALSRDEAIASASVLLREFLEYSFRILDIVLRHPLSFFQEYTFTKHGSNLSEDALIYPFTTFLATNFATSIWIWVTASAAVFARLVIFENKAADYVKNVRLTKRAVFYFGLCVSILICLLVI